MAENKSRINDNNYYIVNGFMINRLRLKGVSLSVYAIIYGFSQDGENEFTGSLQYLCDFCGGVSKPTIIKALKDLVEQGLIIRREEIINNILFTRYRINPDIYDAAKGGKEILPPVKNFNGGSKETLPVGSKNSLMGSKETLPNNKDINNLFKNKSEKEKENIKEQEKAIVDYLNQKAGLRFRASSKITQSHIHARLAEGFTVEDFKIVIDKKCAEWLGTDFAQYLRPTTLFGTKFEAYLNAPAVNRRNYGQTGVAVTKPEADDLAGIL